MTSVCSPSEPASLDRLFLDRPIVFESLVCQLPQTVSQLSWLPFLSVSSAPSAFPSSFLHNRQVLTGSSSSALLHSRASLPRAVSSFRSVFTECSKNRVFDFHCHGHVTALQVCFFFSSLRFTGSAGGETGVASRLGDFIIDRFFTGTFSCVAVRFPLLLVLDFPRASFRVHWLPPAPRRLPPVLLLVLPSYPHLLLVVHEEYRRVQLQVGCPQIVVFGPLRCLDDSSEGFF